MNVTHTNIFQCKFVLCLFYHVHLLFDLTMKHKAVVMLLTKNQQSPHVSLITLATDSRFLCSLENISCCTSKVQRDALSTYSCNLSSLPSFFIFFFSRSLYRRGKVWSHNSVWGETQSSALSVNKQAETHTRSITEFLLCD